MSWDTFGLIQGLLRSSFADFCSNTTITVFAICTRKSAWGLSTNWACEVGKIIEGNIPGTDRKNSFCFVYCPDMLKTYQRKK